MEPGDVQENKTPVIPGEELVPQADDFALPEEELAPQEAVSIQPEEVLTPQNKLFVPNREVSSAQPEDVLTPQNTSPILSPASFGMKDPSKEQEEAGREEENLPFYKQVNFWKNIIVYVFAALLVGALIYGVVYFFNRYNEAEAKEKRKNTNKAADTVTEETEYIGGLPNAISDLQRALSGGSGSGSGSGSATLNVSDIKELCRQNGLNVMDVGNSPVSFIAYDETMQLIVSVDDMQGYDIDTMLTNMVEGSAPLDSGQLIRTENGIRYEGYLSKDEPGLGYCYLELICVGGRYVFVQGLTDSPNHPLIKQAEDLASEIEKLMNVSLV